jgi:hypothetical protein
MEDEFGQPSKDYNFPLVNSSSSDLNLETGIFTAPTNRQYMITLTAMIAGTGRRESPGLSSYAQLFLLKNGKLESLENYLLLEQGMVGDMRVNVAMNNGDTLQVYVGHHVSSMSTYGPSGARDTTQGFNMEQVRFCIF